MLWLRRGWLWVIACAVVLAGGSALVMRFELFDPEPTLAPEQYGHALVLHGLVSLGVLVATVLAIPTLVVRPGRGSVVLGFLALGLWVAAIVPLVCLDLLGSLQWPGFSPQNMLFVLAASLALGAAQIVVSLPTNADRASRLQLVAAVGGIVAIAIVVTPLLDRKLPGAVYWLLAATTVVCGLIPDATKRVGLSFALLAIAPCLLLAWVATALVHVVHTSYFHDTVAMLSPLPVTGGALFGALLLAATRSRLPQRRLVHVAAVLITAGSSLTSFGFLLLGSRGLPRRYFAYLPEYQSLQIMVGVAAAIAAIGCLAALEAFRRGTRTDA